MPYVLQGADVRRLSSMLAWFEKQVALGAPPSARPLRYEEYPRPQWLMQPVYASGGWNVRVWGGFIAREQTTVFWPTGDADSTEYIDVPVPTLSEGDVLYVVWSDDPEVGDFPLGGVSLETKDDLRLLNGQYAVIGLVEGVGSSGIEIQQWKTDTITLAPAETWQMRLSISGQAIFSYCFYQRMFLVREAANVDGDGQIVGTVSMTGTRYVGVSIDDESGNATIIDGASLEDISYPDVPADQSVAKIPLYLVKDGHVVCSLRNLIQMGFYATP